MHPLRIAYADGEGKRGPALVGVDYDDTLPEQRRVYLHWQAGRDAVQVRLRSGDQVVAQDHVPADPEPGRGPGYVTVALDVPPGARDLRIEAWSLDGMRAEGAHVVPRRGLWGLPRTNAAALPQPRVRQAYVPLGGKMTLVDARLDEPWKVGHDARVALRFVSQQPIVRDYVVSVGVSGPVATDAPSDWVPALGAIPTFKWVRGTCVSDVHLIDVASLQETDALYPKVEVSVGVYDAFTTAALPPLDERIARQGRTGVGLGQVWVWPQFDGNP
jgi:hypothetical protein